MLPNTIILLLLFTTFSFSQNNTLSDKAQSLEPVKKLYLDGDYRGVLAHLTDRPVLSHRADTLYLKGYSHLMLQEYSKAVEAFGQTFTSDPRFDPRTIYQDPKN